jgi:hypothetical protein
MATIYTVSAAQVSLGGEDLNVVHVSDPEWPVVLAIPEHIEAGVSRRVVSMLSMTRAGARELKDVLERILSQPDG